MKTIPYGHQCIDKKDIHAVVGVLGSDRLTQGPKIQEFEDALCKYTNAKYAVAVSSGTAALHIACVAGGLTQDDEVIVSPITFIASANCVIYSGGRPVFVDTEESTGNINPAGIEEKITKRTKAIIPVHFSGHPCDLKRIYCMARKYGLIVIEDAAHALGARYRGSKIGACKYSDMTIFSFHPLKSITTAEGGAVLTNKKYLYKKLVMLRNHGIANNNFIHRPDGDWYYEMQLLGYNFRITDIQAALGKSQLKKLDRFIEKRRKIAKIYDKFFKNNPYFELPIEKEYVYSAYHLYPIRIKEPYKKKKKEIFSKLRKKKIGVQVHYIPVYLHPYYRKIGFKNKQCPKAEAFYKKEISLPLYPSIRNKAIHYVIETVLNVFKDIGNR